MREQSNFLPVVLIVIGVMGSFWCLNHTVDLFLAGDLAGQESILGFACFNVLAVLGWHELRATNLHKGD